MKIVLKTKRSPLLLIGLALLQQSAIVGQQIGLSNEEIEAVRTSVLTDAMSDDFWLTPAEDGAHGVAAYTFASYYLGVNTEIANYHILTINNSSLANMTFEDFHFYHPMLMYYLLDERFKKNMSIAAEAHLLSCVYNSLNEYDYTGNLDNVWYYSGSENHNTIRRVLIYLGGLALWQSEDYKDTTFINGKSVQEYVALGAQFWKEYFKGRAEKGLEVEIHAPNYTKYTISCFYAVRDLSDDSDLRTLADLYMNLYWADKAQLYLHDNSTLGGAANRVYKRHIIRPFNHYPRFYGKLFGWTNLSWWPSHPGTFILLCTHYRVPELISQMAITEKPNFLVSNTSPGMIPNTGLDEDLRNIIFDEEGDSHVLSQSYVTPDYVIGTKIFNPEKEYAGIAKQNNMSGVFFDDEDNSRIIMHGYSKLKDGEEKGYRDVVGITGENCMIAWRPAEYDIDRAKGIYIFLTNKMYLAGENIGGWWFCEVGDAYLAMRVVNGWWTVKPIDVYTDGIHFLLDDPDSPVIIECAQPDDYADCADFINTILANSYIITNNTLNYTSTAGDTYKVYRNSSELPEINGQVVDFNVDQTYTSPYINGSTSSKPLEVEITFNNQKLTIDFENITMVSDTLSTGIDTGLQSEQCLLAYPNPSITGRFQLRDASSGWQVISIAGRIVKQGNTPVIDISNYQKGIYILRVGNHCQKIVYY